MEAYRRPTGKYYISRGEGSPLTRYCRKCFPHVLYTVSVDCRAHRVVACSANSMPQSTAKFRLPSDLQMLSSKLHPRRAGPL